MAFISLHLKNMMHDFCMVEFQGNKLVYNYSFMFSYILHPNYLKWHVRTIAKSGWVGEGGLVLLGQTMNGNKLTEMIWNMESSRAGHCSLVGFSLVDLEWTKVSFPHEELLDHLLGLGGVRVQFGPLVRLVVYLPVFASLQWGKRQIARCECTAHLSNKWNGSFTTTTMVKKNKNPVYKDNSRPEK